MTEAGVAVKIWMKNKRHKIFLLDTFLLLERVCMTNEKTFKIIDFVLVFGAGISLETCPELTA